MTRPWLIPPGDRAADATRATAERPGAGHRPHPQRGDAVAHHHTQEPQP